MFFSEFFLLVSISLCDGGLANPQDGNETSSAAVKIQLRIVEDDVTKQSTFSSSSESLNLQDQLLDDTLIPKRNPNSATPIPLQLRNLTEKCFNSSKDGYLYRLCPFRNVTQHKIGGYNYQRLKFVLGIWEAWDISDYPPFLLTKLMFLDGDDCPNSLSRSTEVQFICGDRNAVKEISEPSMCHYRLEFETPLVCDEAKVDASEAVLTPLERRGIDSFQGALFDEEITEQGYKGLMRQLFERAGLIVSTVEGPVSSEESSTMQPSDSDNGMAVAELKKKADFFKSSLDECQRAMAELEKPESFLDRVKGELDSLTEEEKASQCRTICGGNKSEIVHVEL